MAGCCLRRLYKDVVPHLRSPTTIKSQYEDGKIVLCFQVNRTAIHDFRNHVSFNPLK